MEMIKTNCPACTVPLEFPSNSDHVICGVCGAAYQVRNYKGTISLTISGKDDQALLLPEEASNPTAIETALVELNEDIERVTEEVEVLRANERTVPLQLGCSLFGTFGVLLLVLAVFVTLGKNYFGGWLFWLAVAAVILLSLTRMRKKRVSPEKIEYYRSERARMELVLEQLHSERTRLENLQDSINPEDRS
jgi:LSD1 subclass zinc finger protein